MKTTTIRLPESLYHRLSEEAEEREMSFSEYARELLRNRSHQNQRPGRKVDTEQNSDLVARLSSIESRVAALENGRDRSDTLPGNADGSGSERESGNLRDVRRAVKSFANEHWDDDHRLEARVEAATAVLSEAIKTGEAIGKSDADRWFDQYPVKGQKKETWWRKNIRPVLKEYGEYDRGSHGYRVSA